MDTVETEPVDRDTEEHVNTGPVVILAVSEEPIVSTYTKNIPEEISEKVNKETVIKESKKEYVYRKY